MASRFWVGGTGTWDASDTTHWSATSGGAGGQSVPGSSDTVTLDASSGGGTVTVNTNFSVISVTMGAFTGTLTFATNNNSPTVQTFSCSGTGTRTLNLGSGTFTVSGNNATIWDFTTTTNLTFNAGTSTLNFTYSGSTGTRILGFGGTTVFNVMISAGTDTVSPNPTIANNFDCTGFTGTLGNSGLTLSGNFIAGAGMTVSSGGSIMTMITTGNASITTNGVILNRPVTINATGTVSLNDNLNMSGATPYSFNLTSGTFNTNGFNIRCGSVNSNNSNTRTMNLGSTVWTLEDTGTAWTFANSTGLTFNGGTSTIIFTNSSLNFTFGSSISYNTVQFTGADPAIQLTGSGNTFIANSVSVTNSTSGTATLQLNSGVSWNVASYSGGNTTMVFNSGSAQTVTSNSNSFYAITVSKTGGTVTFTDNFVAINSMTLTSGGLSMQGDVVSPSFTSSNTNTRTLSMGTGTWTITGSGTVWDTSTTTGLTLNAGTSTIKLTNTSASSKTFAGGVNTFNNLWFTGGTGILIMGTSTAAMTFNNIRIDPGSTVQIFAGKTINASSLTWSGTFSSRNTFQSTSSGVAWTISVPSGIVSEDYISLQDSTATGGATFYAGLHSTNVSGNTGWIFTSSPVVGGGDTAYKDENGVSTMLGVSMNNGYQTARILANPSNHALRVSNGTTGSDNGQPNAEHDANAVPSLLAVSSVDGVTPVELYVNPSTGEILIQST